MHRETELMKLQEAETARNQNNLLRARQLRQYLSEIRKKPHNATYFKLRNVDKEGEIERVKQEISTLETK